MNLEAAVDRRLVRAGGHSVRHLLVRLTAPSAPSDRPRPALRIAFVVDRSGSMAGSKLSLACQATAHALSLLGGGDRFALVVYDDRVNVLVPETHATGDAVAAARAALVGVSPGGTTNLAEGWLVGCDQVARDPADDALARALLLSDGLANVGLTDAGELAHHAGQLRARGVVTTAFGLGADFDEALLQSMATAGGGNFYFIEAADQIRDFFASELGEALEVVAPGGRLLLDLPREVEVRALSAFALVREGRRAVVDLGDVVSDQRLELVLQLRFPRAAEGTGFPVSVQVGADNDAFDGLHPCALELEAAGKAENDGQPRDREVDLAAALRYAARARQEAVAANRRGDLEGAEAMVRRVAQRISTYAGDDARLRDLVATLEEDARAYGRRMAELERKSRHWDSSSSLRCRLSDGTSMRTRPPTSDS